MAVLLGLLLFVIIAAVVMFMWVNFDPKEWVHTNDPTVVDLIEKYEQLPEYKKEVIRDIADDG